MQCSHLNLFARHTHADNGHNIDTAFAIGRTEGHLAEEPSDLRDFCVLDIVEL